MQPPYYAVIFTARIKSTSQEYFDTAAELKKLAEEIPGYLGIESVEQDNGTEITVSYWKTREAIQQWREHPDHQQAQQRAREEWYDHYRVQIAEVKQAYEFEL